MNLALTAKKMEGIAVLSYVPDNHKLIRKLPLSSFFMDGNTREKGSTIVIFVVALALVSLVIPGISAAVPDYTPRITQFITYPDIMVTNGSLTNHTIPSEFRVTPTLLKVQVELPETALPGPKGEMAIGPRAIGFSTDPASLAIVILAVVAVAAGIGYFLKRKQDEEDRE